MVSGLMTSKIGGFVVDTVVVSTAASGWLPSSTSAMSGSRRRLVSSEELDLLNPLVLLGSSVNLDIGGVKEKMDLGPSLIRRRNRTDILGRQMLTMDMGASDASQYMLGTAASVGVFSGSCRAEAE